LAEITKKYLQADVSKSAAHTVPAEKQVSWRWKELLLLAPQRERKVFGNSKAVGSFKWQNRKYDHFQCALKNVKTFARLAK
jgi:hypothetical protein